MLDSWSMKKSLVIVVLSLMLSENAVAKEVIINCDNYKITGTKKNGVVSNEPGSDYLDRLFKINTSKKKVFEFNNFSNKFYERKVTSWNEKTIRWKDDDSKTTILSELNRFNLDHKHTVIYKDDDIWNRIVEFSRCSIGQKKL